MGAQGLENYAGARQHYAQCLLASETVRRGWGICATDISKTFLQGMTYTELSQATGEPLREVKCNLSAYCVAVLRHIPECENFDSCAEVLRCEEPGA
eukprot:5019666-Alexandrium_andersonii.AAC.1